MSESQRHTVPIDPGEPSPGPGPAGGLSRRAALQGIAGGLGAAFAARSAGAEEPHPIGAHVEQRQKAPTPRPAAPQFFDPHQFATLAVVADLIVPGAVASESHHFIDNVLAIERPQVQQQFVGALSGLDAAARDQHQQAFVVLARDRQIALLEDAAHRDAVAHLKTWIAGAHYSSEAGMKELGWTGAVLFPAFPGCTHPEGHR